MRFPQPCSTIPIIRENGFNLFDSKTLATLYFKILWHNKRMTLQNFLQTKQRDVW